MKKYLFVTLLFLPLSFFSCKMGGAGDPKKVLSKFFDAIKKKDMHAAKELVTEDSKPVIDHMETRMKMDKDGSGDEFESSKLEYGEPKIEGNIATISVKGFNDSGPMDFTLIKENALWKVTFNIDLLMGKTLEEMEEKNINVGDSMNKAFNELKKVNTDSLEGKLEEGRRIVDSINKELKKLDPK